MSITATKYRLIGCSLFKGEWGGYLEENTSLATCQWAHLFCAKPGFLGASGIITCKHIRHKFFQRGVGVNILASPDLKISTPVHK